MGDPLLGDIPQMRTSGPQAPGTNLAWRTPSTSPCGLSWLGNNPALSKICSKHLNRKLGRTPQVPYQRASYRASSGNKSLSPVRIFFFMILPNLIYKQKSMQAKLGLQQPACRT